MILIETSFSILDVPAARPRPLHHFEQEICGRFEAVAAGHEGQEEDVEESQELCNPPACVCACVCMCVCVCV